MLNYPLLYLEHLSERDLDLIAMTAGASEERARFRARLSERPEMLDELLAKPDLFDAVFSQEEPEAWSRITPFLAFGVLVHRLGRDLASDEYVPEWAGPGRRLPVFDVGPLRDFLDQGIRRFFLIELLASFTKVASGSIWVRTRRGYRRRRYSELDPVRLVEMVDHLPAAHRPAGYRRLGDVALFLSGVFPDHTARYPLAPTERESLARSAGIGSIGALAEGLGFHEAAGAGWYRRAVDDAAALMGAGPEYLRDVADRFSEARRILNLLGDRYLHRFDAGLIQPG
ncbi:MAG: hypothetical protein ACE5MI_06240 [Acidimicrobiia bacterium]